MDFTKFSEALKKAIHSQNPSALEKLAQDTGDDFATFINRPMEDYNLPLLLAVSLGNTDIVTYLLSRGAAINEKGLGETALGIAAEKGDVSMVKLLLCYKPDVNGRGSGGFSALYWAAWRGHTDIVALLLAAKARVDIKTSDRETPLYAAARNGHLAIARLLVEHGAEVNMICSDGSDTALSAACSADYPDIVKYLLDQGASPNGIGDKTPENFYTFPLYSARSGTVVELLLAAGAKVNAQNRHQDTALHNLVRQAKKSEGAQKAKYLEAIKLLLARGADPLAKNGSAVNTPLALASSPEVTALLREAIDRKNAAATDEPSKSGTQLGEPLFKMARNCNEAEQLAALLSLIGQAGPEDVRYQSPGDHDATILHQIINSMPYDPASHKVPFAPYLKVVCLLLEKGADVNATGDTRKESPLHIAARRSSYAGKYHATAYRQDYIDLVQLLLDRQASLSALSRDGCSPLDLATYEPVAALLKERGAVYAALSDEVINQIKEGRIDAFEQGMPIELKDKEGNTPLMIAALKNNISAIKYFVGKGADTQARNSKWQNNALDIACLSCSLEVVRYLVSHVSIDINAIDPVSADTALHYLAAWQPTFHHKDPAGMKKAADETCIWMIQQGAAIDLKNKSGKTATDMARTQKLATAMLRAAKKKQ